MWIAYSLAVFNVGRLKLGLRPEKRSHCGVNVVVNGCTTGGMGRSTEKGVNVNGLLETSSSARALLPRGDTREQSPPPPAARVPSPSIPNLMSSRLVSRRLISPPFGLPFEKTQST